MLIRSNIKLLRMQQLLRWNNPIVKSRKAFHLMTDISYNSLTLEWQSDWHGISVTAAIQQRQELIKQHIRLIVALKREQQDLTPTVGIYVNFDLYVLGLLAGMPS